MGEETEERGMDLWVRRVKRRGVWMMTRILNDDWDLERDPRATHSIPKSKSLWNLSPASYQSCHLQSACSVGVSPAWSSQSYSKTSLFVYTWLFHMHTWLSCTRLTCRHDYLRFQCLSYLKKEKKKKNNCVTQWFCFGVFLTSEG